MDGGWAILGVEVPFTSPGEDSQLLGHEGRVGGGQGEEPRGAQARLLQCHHSLHWRRSQAGE